MNNPYLDEANEICFDNYGISCPNRKSLVHKYAWAVPDERAINLIKRYSPIIELGAGKGYWANLINAAGGDIICYDNHSWGYTSDYFKVLKSEPGIAGENPERALMLCWPPYDRPFAYESLKAHRESGGKYLIYIGEPKYGCTACNKFFEYLDKHYKTEHIHDIFQFDGIHDYLGIYKAV